MVSKRFQITVLIITVLLISSMDQIDAKKRKNNRNDDDEQHPRTGDTLDKVNKLDEKKNVPVEDCKSSSSEEEEEKDKAKGEGEEVKTIAADKQVRKRREHELKRQLEMNEGESILRTQGSDQDSKKGQLISSITTHKHNGGPDHGPVVDVETNENHGHRHNHGHAGHQRFQHYHPRNTQRHDIFKRSVDVEGQEGQKVVDVDGEVKAPEEIREIVAKEMVRQGLMESQYPVGGVGARGRVLPLPNTDHRKYPHIHNEQL